MFNRDATLVTVRLSVAYFCGIHSAVSSASIEVAIWADDAPLESSIVVPMNDLRTIGPGNAAHGIQVGGLSSMVRLAAFRLVGPRAIRALNMTGGPQERC